MGKEMFKYTWAVQLDDLSMIRQFARDGEENMWRDVPQARIILFCWEPTNPKDERHEFKVPLGAGCEPYRTTVINNRSDTPVTMSYNVKVGSLLSTVHSTGEKTSRLVSE